MLQEYQKTMLHLICTRRKAMPQLRPLSEPSAEDMCMRADYTPQYVWSICHSRWHSMCLRPAFSSWIVYSSVSPRAPYEVGSSRFIDITQGIHLRDTLAMTILTTWESIHSEDVCALH